MYNTMQWHHLSTPQILTISVSHDIDFFVLFFTLFNLAVFRKRKTRQEKKKEVLNGSAFWKGLSSEVGHFLGLQKALGSVPGIAW